MDMGQKLSDYLGLLVLLFVLLTLWCCALKKSSDRVIFESRTWTVFTSFVYLADLLLLVSTGAYSEESHTQLCRYCVDKPAGVRPKLADTWQSDLFRLWVPKVDVSGTDKLIDKHWTVRWQGHAWKFPIGVERIIKKYFLESINTTSIRQLA